MGRGRSKRKAKTQNYVYAPVYTEKDYLKDEAEFTKGEKSGNVNWTAFQRLMLHDICINSRIIENGYIGNVKLDDIHSALVSPACNWYVLLSASEELMHISPHYYRLNMMFSNMALFQWGIDLCDVKQSANKVTVKNTYLSLASKLESMNLKHEFSKIMKVIPYQDIFCGLLVENESDCFIQQIPYKNCKLYRVQDGLYSFAINLTTINPQKINAYPLYVQEAYLDFKDKKIASYWYEPPVDKQICIKLNSQWTYPFPLLIGLVQDILDLDVYKKLKLQSARTDNYKAIMVKVPIDTSTVDKPLLTPETLGIFAEINRESMSDDIGLIHTLGSDGTAISFKDSNNTRNNVSDAVNELYNSSGESRELFNGSSSGTAVTLSIENDAGFIYGLYRQFERWVNRFIKLRKYNKSTFKFSFYILDTTIFNRDNVSKRYKEACTLGATVIDKWIATLDITPSRLLGSYITHDEIFQFHDHFIPLSSTYNSGDTNAGRPTNKSKGEGLTESGESTADSDANIDR